MNSSTRCLRPGPANVNEGFLWAEQFAETLKHNNFGVDFWESLCAKWEAGLVLSSDYSGCGQFETAAGMIRHVIERSGRSLGQDWRLHRATDVLPHCRRTLQAHSPHAPGCIFGDMLDRMEPEVAAQLDNMLLKVGLSAATPAEKQAACEEATDIIAGLVKDMHEQGKLPTDITARCYQHERTCRVVQRRSGQDAGRLLVHAAGVSCVDWSSRGRQRGFAGPTARVFTQWLIERRVAEEDLILVECTRRFQPALLQKVFFDYDMYSHVFSPSHLGFACDRHRVYVMLIRRSSLRLAVPWGSAAVFKDLFYRNVGLHGSVYFRAPAELVGKRVSEMALARHLPAHQQGGEPWEFKHVIPSGKRKRIQEYVQHAIAKDPNSATPDFIFDAEQYPSYGGLTRRVPALTQSIQPYSLVHKRTMLAEEKLEVMGLPVFAPSDFAVQTPFRSLILDGVLSEKQLHSMMGNAMHAAAIGSWLMFALGCTREAPGA